MDDLVFYDVESGLYRLADEGEGEDSGVEELPFMSYQDFDEDLYNEVRSYTQSQRSGSYGDNDDEDCLSYVDDENDKDYKPSKSAVSKKVGMRYKKRGSPVPGSGPYNLSFFTPEKLGTDQSDSEMSGGLKSYGRKPRTPRTIMKMMEKHRESERVRHHSLNESLKDVCMRVPGYDPSCKETKVIQMQRIIGYECFLENTLRELCTQLSVPDDQAHINSNFITDALNKTPIEEFYNQSSFPCGDEDTCGSPDLSSVYQDMYDAFREGGFRSGDSEHSTRPSGSHTERRGRKSSLPPGCRVIDASSIEKKVVKYRRDKISSPTVDSTTTDVIRIQPLSPASRVDPAQGVPLREPRRCRWVQGDAEHSWQAERFKPITSPQRSHLSSQESGIKMESQSILEEEDTHFQDIDSLIEEGLCQESSQLRDVTPSFMKEEPVTSTEEGDAGFDLSSPVRHTSHIFLHSPPPKGIWHSCSKLSLASSGDTPGCKEMLTVSPENVLETKPKPRRTVHDENSSCLNTQENRTPKNVNKGRRSASNISCLPAAKGVCLLPQASGATVHSTPDTYTTVKAWNSIQSSVITSHIRSNPPLDTSTVNQVTILSSSDQKRDPSDVTSNPWPGAQRKVPSTVNVRVNIVNPAKGTMRSNSRPALTYALQENTGPIHYSLTNTNLQTKPCKTNSYSRTLIYKPPLSSFENQSPEKSNGIISLANETTPIATRNKRKRYTPVKSPDGRAVTKVYGADEEDIENMKTPEEKKARMDFDNLPLVGIPKPVYGLLCRKHIGNRNLGSVTLMRNRGGSGRGRVASVVPVKVKTDYRKTTWMNGFMMFCQMNRHKYASAHHGLPVSEVQKVMGYMWRNMTAEEQAPYREKAQQCSAYLQETQDMNQNQPTSYSILPVHQVENIEPNIISISSETLG